MPAGDVMESRPDPTNTIWPFPFTPQDWAQTPLAVQAYVRTLRDEVAQLQNRMETLETRLQQNSTTSSRPPASDSPYKKPRRRTAPTSVQEVRPAQCACGNTTLALTTP